MLRYKLARFLGRAPIQGSGCRCRAPHRPLLRTVWSSYPLISHVVLCGMSIAKEPSGSPAGAGFLMQANGSLPVIPLYLPVPPVTIWVPQSIFGCDLSRSRVSNVEKTTSPSLSVSAQAPSIHFLAPDSTLTAAHFAFILWSIASPFVFSVGPTASSAVALPTPGISMLDLGWNTKCVV